MTKRELEAEVERLRIEVTLLRSMQAAHVCPQWPANLTWPYPPAQPWPGWPQPYVGDVPPYNGWTNVCAGAAGVPQTVMISSGESYTWLNPAAGCAAGVPQILRFNVPA